METEAASTGHKNDQCCDKCGKWSKKYWWVILIIVIVIITSAVIAIIVATIKEAEEAVKEAEDEILEDIGEEIEKELLCAFEKDKCYNPYVDASAWKSAVDSCYYNESDGAYAAKGFINSGTPQYVDIEFDCKMRQYAYEYGKNMQPRHGSFLHLFDALQLQVCDEIRPSQDTEYIDEYPTYSEYTIWEFYVDPINGSDEIYNGSFEFPFKSIQRAINETRYLRTANYTFDDEVVVINLMEGTYYLDSTVTLTQIDSNLIIQNYNGSEVTVSGGKPLIFEDNWNCSDYEQTQWMKFTGYNNVYGITSIGSHVKDLGKMENYTECQQAVQDADDTHGPFYSFTYITSGVDSVDNKSCFGIRDISWQPVLESGYESGRYIGKNIWYNTIENINDFEDGMIYGLRTNNKRGINARFPDQDPETSMQYFAWNGWITAPSKTGKITFPDASEIVLNKNTDPNYRDTSIVWPLRQPGNGTNFTGFGAWGNYSMSYGGICDSDYDDVGLGSWQIPYGFFCSKDNPRKEYLLSPNESIYYHICPKSIYLNETVLPNLSNYTDISNNCKIHAYRPDNWYNWIFQCGDFNPMTNELNFSKGGFQGTQGANDTGYYYIENVFEELTMPNEYYYNQSTNTLYYFHNASNKTAPNNINFVGTNLRTLFNISSTHKNEYVHNIKIRGLTLRDTRYTYLDDGYNALSGGDYGLSRNGAIFLSNTKNCSINDNTFTRLDGNGIFLSGYNRYTSIKNNNFEWIGENAMVAWGYTTYHNNTYLPYGVGPDGRNGDQPRYTFVENNLVREIGIWVKQSAGWNQAQSCQTYLKNNIFFNGPRSAINFNDGFGGDNHVSGNLAFNFLRESGDNGIFNSWDRVPYITEVNENYTNGSIIPGWNHIDHNFFIGNYIAFVTVDNDDGSAYYKTYNNFIVYGGWGLKSDYAGHDNRHYNNTYAYINDWVLLLQQAGANDWFIDNKVILTNDCGYYANCGIFDLKDIGIDFGIPGSDFRYATNMKIGNNSIYVPSGSIDEAMLAFCGITFEEWQAEGNDIGTTINPIPSPYEIIFMANQTLQT